MPMDSIKTHAGFKVGDRVMYRGDLPSRWMLRKVVGFAGELVVTMFVFRSPLTAGAFGQRLSIHPLNLRKEKSR